MPARNRRKAGSSRIGGRCERLKDAYAARRALNLSSLQLLLKREFLSFELLDFQFQVSVELLGGAADDLREERGQADPIYCHYLRG
ncbi:MAG: hypothetical protein A3H45_00215 [Ignavibacteria bacterium RIFCSPLOWO2_02_FULL_55_14]|nr:MAG: hypothetical protein A3H45_00215 [Ignavibacteria bacterium RIFCSPLOWO2_02_FULL_55_14]